MLHVAETDDGNIVGYVLAKLEDEDEKNKAKPLEAHITSLSVLRSHRKLGLATKLMKATHRQMTRVFKVDLCSLRVRVTNRAAYTLYNDVLKYTTRGIENNYYADGEDAFDMQLKLSDINKQEESKEPVPEGN